MSLLSFSEQQAIKEVSINNQKRFLQIIKEVEELELSKLLGYQFYQLVSTTPSSFTELLNGCAFVDSNGVTIAHKGLKYILSYLNYSQYIAESNIQDTFTGMVQKVRDDSTQVSLGLIKQQQTHNREIAFTAWDLTKLYLDLNQSIYPTWNISVANKRTYTPKFIGIKNTKR